VGVKGIGMTGGNVQLLQAGRKWQTRRLLKPQPTHDKDGWTHLTYQQRCWYGIAGDALYVREACRAVMLDEGEARARQQAPGTAGVVYPADNAFEPLAAHPQADERWRDLYTYGAKRGHSNRRGRLVPDKYAPRWTSRITLELTHVRAEQLHAISTADAWAEGMNSIGEYLKLWDRIHGPGSAAANPWVWVLQFRVHQLNVDTWLASRAAA
jgi:hypothetical protein